MIVTLLALLLLGGLVFYVINLSHHVNDRISSQHAADAAAAAGAGWLARSMNTIAANNTQMARLVAAAAVMDAMDEAVTFTLTEQQVLRDRLDEQLDRGRLSDHGALDRLVRDLLSRTAHDMDEHIDELSATAAALRRSGAAAAASYADDGRLWRAIDAADRLNVSLAQQMDQAVRAAASSGGEANLADAPAGAAAVTLLPLELDLPVERGRFDDFARPVLHGLIPENEDHRIHARGPWDTLLGWRDQVGRWVESSAVSGRVRVAHVSPDAQAVPVTRAAVQDARAVEAHFEPHAYRTYGPLEWMLRQVREHAVDQLGSTRLDWYVQRLTDTKIDRLWPQEQREPERRDAGLVTADADHAIGRFREWGEHRPVVEPDWRTSFSEARRIADRSPERIKETAFFVVEIKSRFPPGHARFLAPGTWAEVSDETSGQRRLVIRPGWEDPRQWHNARFIGEWVWQDVWEYSVYYDADLDVHAEHADDGRLAPQPLYRLDHVAFAGVNVGEEAGIRDPFAGLSRGSNDAPAPMRLNPELLGHDDAAARREHLSVLAVVRRESRAAVWGERFVGGGPTGDMLTIAQARVFNHHSWDLWTQTWRSELEAVSRFDDWVEGMAGLTADHESQQVYQHLQALQPLAPLMLSH